MGGFGRAGVFLPLGFNGQFGVMRQVFHASNGVLGDRETGEVEFYTLCGKKFREDASIELNNKKVTCKPCLAKLKKRASYK